MDVVNRGSKLKEYKNAQTAKHIYEEFDTIACVSDSCKFKFIEKFGFEEKCVTVYNPMPVDDIMEKANENTTLFDKSRLNIVCVGRLEMQKGFDRLIEVVNRLKNKNYHYKIHIIGDGTMKDQLQNEINILGLENYIELLGFIGNPYPYINNADLFLLSSRDEAFPLAIGECIILQTPILSTDCSGVAEWFGKYQCGKIVANDTDSLYHGFKDILDNPSIIDEYKKKIVLRSEEISFQQAMDEFEHIILQ